MAVRYRALRIVLQRLLFLALAASCSEAAHFPYDGVAAGQFES